MKNKTHSHLPSAFCLLLFAFSLSPFASAAAQEDPAAAPRIETAEFKALLAKGGVIVVDVRSADSYNAGHIPGALSIPLGDLPTRAGELKKELVKKDRPVVTYCA